MECEARAFSLASSELFSHMICLSGASIFQRSSHVFCVI